MILWRDFTANRQPYKEKIGGIQGIIENRTTLSILKDMHLSDDSIEETLDTSRAMKYRLPRVFLQRFHPPAEQDIFENIAVAVLA